MTRRSFFTRILTAVGVPCASNIDADRRVDIRGTMTCDHPLALGVEVVNLDTGRTVSLVRAVNTEEGWVESYKADKHGRIQFRAPGNIVQWEERCGKQFPIYQRGWDDPVVEFQRGHYEVRRKLQHA